MLRTNATEMTNSAREYSSAVRAAVRKYGAGRETRPVCFHRSAVGIEEDRRITSLKSPALILTSPPYPGVHILYHRWQVQGRRESPAPFWIANSLDGEGASYYTFGDRHSTDLTKYFSQAEAAFRSVAGICDRRTVVVQMIAFSEPDWQLPAYLAAMERAGLPGIRSMALVQRMAGSGEAFPIVGGTPAGERKFPVVKKSCFFTRSLRPPTLGHYV